MRLEPVPSEYVHVVWPQAQALLVDTFKLDESEFTMEQLHAMVAVGMWNLLAVTDGKDLCAVMVVCTYNRPNDRVVFIKAIGGHGAVTDEIMKQLMQYAVSVGATSVEAAVRPAMQRLMSRVGFTEKYRIVGATV